MKLIVILCLVLSALFVVVPLYAQETVVWQIGSFDGNYEELAIPHANANYSTIFPNDVTFTVGKDDPAKLWPFIQPGPADSWAAVKLHPFTIVFNLADQPQGFYRLRIGLVNTHSSLPPTLEVRVNDNVDRINLPNGGSDEALEDASKGQKHELNINIPVAYLGKGENKVVLTIVGGSNMIYDALSFSKSESRAAMQSTIGDINLKPTFRFVRKGSQLKRVVQLTAQVSQINDVPSARVVFDGKIQTLLLKSTLFGSISAEIEIADILKPARLEVTLQCGGQSKTASCEIRPEKHWKLFVMPVAHVDIGYTDLQENVKQRHNENLSLAIDLCRKYPDFQWNTEVAWVQDNYLSMMPEERKAEFIRLAQSGRIGCQAIYGNMLTGICSHEELIRNLYYSHSAAKQYRIPFDMAVSCDVPTQVWTLPSILAGSGIRYFVSALNTVRAESATRLYNKPFYWKGQDGASVLTWLYPGYKGASNKLGLADSVVRARGLIDDAISEISNPSYPYDAMMVFGAFADNARLKSSLASVVNEWNRTYAYPKVILCRGPEFFRYIEKNFKSSIPTISGDAGVYWEDGAGSSSQETAENRLAKENLVSAEKIFSLASVLGGKTYPDAELAATWNNAILYDEHTWGADQSISDPECEMTVKQWAYKARFAQDASKNAALLKEHAFDNLSQLVKVTEPSVVVFNPLSWPVSEVVGMLLPDGRTTRFQAEVPAFGFRVYPTSSIIEARCAAPIGDNSLENRFYRVEFDTTFGAVKRLYDKELNRELVDSAARYGINQYVYVSGVSEATKETVNTGPVILAAESRPGCQVMTVRGAALNTPSWATEVVLYDDQKRIDFLNTLNKTSTYQKEAGYFAFPFGLNKAEFHVALPNGVVNPAKEMLPGGCMAWYCAQDFVTASDEGVSVTWTALDSPLVTLCDINREGAESPLAASNWPSPLNNGHIFGYVFNNYWFTNYKASQGGELRFRFSLTSSRSYDSEAATRFGQTVRNPLLTKLVQPQNSLQANVPELESLVSASPSNVCIQTMKQAESGGGTIIRLREVGGKSAHATITIPKGAFKNAWKCNLVEDKLSKLPLSRGKLNIDIPANGLATILLK